jgi:hypothetical protein
MIVSKIFNNSMLSSEEKTDFMNYLNNLRTASEKYQGGHASFSEKEVFRYVLERYKFSSSENISKMIHAMEAERSQSQTAIGQFKKINQKLEEENTKLKEIMLSEKQKVLSVISKLEISAKESDNKYQQMKKYCKHIEEQKQVPKIDLKEIASMIKMKDHEADKLREEKNHIKYKLMSLVITLNKLLNSANTIGDSIQVQSSIGINDSSHRNVNMVLNSNQTIQDDQPQYNFQSKMQKISKNLLSYRNDDSSLSLSCEFKIPTKNTIDFHSIEQMINEVNTKRSQLKIQNSHEEKGQKSAFLNSYGLNLSFKIGQKDFMQGVSNSNKKPDRISKEITDLDLRIKLAYESSLTVMKSIKSMILTSYQKFKQIDFKKISKHNSLMTTIEGKFIGLNDPFSLIQEYKKLSKTQNLIMGYLQTSQTSFQIPDQTDDLHLVVNEELVKQKYGITSLQNEMADLKAKNEELKRVNKYIMGVLSRKESKLNKFTKEIESEKYLASKRFIDNLPSTRTHEENQLASLTNNSELLYKKQAEIDELKRVNNDLSASIDALESENFYFREKLTDLSENLGKSLSTIEALTYQFQTSTRGLKNLLTSNKHLKMTLKNMNFQYAEESYYNTLVGDLLQANELKIALENLKAKTSHEKIIGEDKKFTKIKRDLSQTIYNYQELENELSLQKSTQSHTIIELNGIINEQKSQINKLFKDKEQLKINLSYTNNELQVKLQELQEMKNHQNSMINKDSEELQLKSQQIEKLYREAEEYKRMNSNLREKIEANQVHIESMKISNTQQTHRLNTEITALKAKIENEQSSAQSTVQIASQLRTRVSDLEKLNNESENIRQSQKDELVLVKKILFKVHKENIKNINLTDEKLSKCELRVNEVVAKQKKFEGLEKRAHHKKQVFALLIHNCSKRIDQLTRMFSNQMNKISTNLKSKLLEHRKSKLHLKSTLDKTKSSLMDYHKILDGIAKAGDFDFNTISVEQVIECFTNRQYIFKKIVELLQINPRSQKLESLVIGKLDKMSADDLNFGEHEKISGFTISKGDDTSHQTVEFYEKFIKQLKNMLPKGRAEECVDLSELALAIKFELQMSKRANSKESSYDRENLQKSSSKQESFNQNYNSSKQSAIIEGKLSNIIQFMMSSFEIDLERETYMEILVNFQSSIRHKETMAERMIANLTSENSNITSKFIAYQEEIYSLKEELEQKKKELKYKENEEKGDDPSFDKQTTSDKSKIKNLQQNIRSLERKLKSCKYIFEVLKLNMNDGNIKEEFMKRMREFKANPNIILLEDKAVNQNKGKYRLYKIDEDQDSEDNQIFMKYPQESFKEIETKSLAMNQLENSNLEYAKNKPNSDRNKLSKRNYFIKSFINYNDPNTKGNFEDLILEDLEF